MVFSILPVLVFRRAFDCFERASCAEDVYKRQPLESDQARVFFRVGNINGQFDIAVFGFMTPDYVLFYPASLDVIDVLGKPVQVISRGARRLLVQTVEFIDDRARPINYRVDYLCLKIVKGDVVLSLIHI